MLLLKLGLLLLQVELKSKKVPSADSILLHRLLQGLKLTVVGWLRCLPVMLYVATQQPGCWAVAKQLIQELDVGRSHAHYGRQSTQRTAGVIHATYRG